jgi:hypothetical protein
MTLFVYEEKELNVVIKLGFRWKCTHFDLMVALVEMKLAE